MIGRHRGTRSLRWRLVGAVIAAAVGRGYEGRHRLEAAALGLPAVTVSAPREPEAARPTPATAPTSGHVTLASGARLTLVPVAPSPDPLVDTVPHPVVKMFPLPVAAPASGATPQVGEDAVFADVERARDEQATAELASGGPATDSYRGRHSA